MKKLSINTDTMGFKVIKAKDGKEYLAIELPNPMFQQDKKTGNYWLNLKITDFKEKTQYNAIANVKQDVPYKEWKAMSKEEQDKIPVLGYIKEEEFKGKTTETNQEPKKEQPKVEGPKKVDDDLPF